MIEALHRAEETIPRLPKPKREGSTPASDETKTLFKTREATLAALAQGTQEFCDTRKDYAQQISKAQRKDKRIELKAAAQELEEAATKHAHPRTIQAALRKLSRKPTHRRKRMVQPSRSSKSGGAGAELFASQEELLAAWRTFDAEKFSATPMETRRGSMPGLGPADASDVPTDEDLEICLEAREGNKSCGPDEIPTELYKCSAESKALLFALIKKIWVREDTPAAMVQGLFVHIFKNKGSQDDMTKYRCICLLNHAFKVMSAYLLLRTLREVGHNLDPSQWGFRKERGTRDAVTLVREIIRWALKEQKSLILIFLDFQAAFDTVSHKFLDEALSSAGASRKTRAIFRDIYVKATARVKIRAPDGRTLLSDSFSVDRGVVQGDIFSPLCFILALALIMKRHGVSSQGLGAFGLLMDHVDYADDVAQCETSAGEASERLTRIAVGARGDADMIISVEKTKAMHVRPRMELGAPSEQDYEDLWASRKKGGLTVEANLASSADASSRTWQAAPLMKLYTVRTGSANSGWWSGSWMFGDLRRRASSRSSGKGTGTRSRDTAGARKESSSWKLPWNSSGPRRLSTARKTSRWMGSGDASAVAGSRPRALGRSRLTRRRIRSKGAARRGPWEGRDRRRSAR